MEMADSMTFVSRLGQCSESFAETASQSKTWRRILVSLEDGQGSIGQSRWNNHTDNIAGSHSGYKGCRTNPGTLGSHDIGVGCVLD